MEMHELSPSKAVEGTLIGGRSSGTQGHHTLIRLPQLEQQLAFNCLSLCFSPGLSRALLWYQPLNASDFPSLTYFCLSLRLGVFLHPLDPQKPFSLDPISTLPTPPTHTYTYFFSRATKHPKWKHVLMFPHVLVAELLALTSFTWVPIAGSGALLWDGRRRRRGLIISMEPSKPTAATHMKETQFLHT